MKNNKKKNLMELFTFYLREINKYKLLNHHEEIELAKRVEKKDRQAYEKLFNSNLKLVVSIAKKYMTVSYQLLDLIQDGNLGLMKAIEKFDYRRNVRFATYATWWIRQAIIREKAEKHKLIRLPLRKVEEIKAINYAYTKLYTELQREPSLKEIAIELNYGEEKVKKLVMLKDSVLSLNCEFNSSYHVTIELIPAEDLDIPYTKFLDSHLKSITGTIIDNLRDEEKKVIQGRFLYEEANKKTLKEIGDEIGVSAEWIRQTEIRSIKKIKKHTYLKEYLYC